MTPELLLRAYAQGLFPMGDAEAPGELAWYDPPWRGILPLADFYVPRRLRQTIRNSPLIISSDRAFARVLAACADTRPATWINGRIRSLYTALAARGQAHSIEVWDGDSLAGGLYGVALRGAFFGESMFHQTRDASKIALVALVAVLRMANFRLLDAQFWTEHLGQFGAREIPRADYHALLAAALQERPTWPEVSDWPSLIQDYLQSITHTS